MNDQNVVVPRKCPLCNGNAGKVVFPFETFFYSQLFKYFECLDCSTVFVDPLPSTVTFEKMYAKSAYHDFHYTEKVSDSYVESVKYLKRYLAHNSVVLDYGSGVGSFLKALKLDGFTPIGVEFDAEAARVAAINAQCVVFPLENFFSQEPMPLFDAIHLGDVLEHLPDPAETISKLINYLRPGGILFVEGPLETNLSLVYFFANIFGSLKHIIRPNLVAQHPPTHLFRTSAKAQANFFNRFSKQLKPVDWNVYETGWPYIDGKGLKFIIAKAAVSLGGIKLAGNIFGNRFRAVYQKVSA